MNPNDSLPGNPAAQTASRRLTSVLNRRLLSLLLLLITSTGLQGQFTYITNDRQITITGYNGPGGAVTIPSKIDGVPVTRIGDSAFYGRSSLTSVMIPNSVTSIGIGAFEDCASLASVTIPNGVTSLGNFLFYNCASLTNATIPNSVASIGDLTYYNCTSLTSVAIPDSVISIGVAAFAQCARLTSVTIPYSVTNIGNSAFFNCGSLDAITVEALNSFYRSVDGILFNHSQTTLLQYPGAKSGSYPIPNSVTTIGPGAFSFCSNLTSIMIPNSVTNIAVEAFTYCPGAITVEALNSFYSSLGGVLFDHSQTTLLQCPLGKAGGYIVPNSVTTIGDSAFASCANLTSVTIPASVIAIGRSAFAFCAGLTNVTISNGVISIGDYAFPFCTNLTRLTIPNSVTTIGSATFSHCRSLTSVTLGSGLTNLGPFAFDSCTSLTSVTIPNRVTTIGDATFSNCPSLTSVTIGSGVTSLGSFAFDYCPNLGAVYFQGNAPAPSSGQPVFGGASMAIIYYLPGTTGWGPTFDGLPTALWNPQAPTTNPNFGLRQGQFGFTITGTANLEIVIEAATNLVNPTWTALSTNTLASGTSDFTDPPWTNHQTRIYRFRSPY